MLQCLDSEKDRHVGPNLGRKILLKLGISSDDKITASIEKLNKTSLS